MEYTINQRIKEITEVYYNGSVNALSKASGISQSTLKDIVGGKSNRPGYDTIMSIIGCSTLNVSLDWLMTGRGSMVKNVEREQKTIEISESAISQTKQKGALIYDIDATCGFDGRDINFADELVVGSIDIPEINSDSKIIVATGDSMQPLIYSGDRIVVRKIESWDYFNYGQVYLIITSEYRFIKRVRKHKDNPDSLIVLRSDNPNYDDVDLPKKEIIHLFIVENILAIKNIL